jgi:hypothetical protein
LLLAIVPARADCSPVRCDVTEVDCGTLSDQLDDAIVIAKVRIDRPVSSNILFENWTLVSSNILHIGMLVRPDKVPTFFAPSLHSTFLRNSALLI